MTAVLYDVPGPSAKRRYLTGSIVAGVVLLAVLAVVIARLAAQDQFTAEKWSALVNPTDSDFVQVWALLANGLQNTLVAAALAMVLSLVIGTVLAVIRLTSAPWYRWAVVGVVELFRGLPVVVLIFFASRVLPEIGVDLPIMWFLVIGLTAYNSVIIAEIVRAGVNSLPAGQREAALAVGMTRGQTLRLILLPQAFRVMLPTLISQLVVILKDTALGFIISYPELLQTGQIIIQNLDNPIPMYFTIALIFIAINYALSKLAEYMERRLSRARRTPAGPPGKTLAGAEMTGD
ncbi:amino acid ABC transporter permease [Pseudonocardia nigra]|uniref:amino acid ABC transporter permease n=1 Tax=Pseudonocardia nigra TaxID=1921578 RepID=UPI001C5FEE44|nr:amino acid ABC transporter permease [Pseudonocardia nigra]